MPSLVSIFGGVRPSQVWRGWAPLFFAFCAHATRDQTSPPRVRWRLEAAGFSALCTACGLLGPAVSPLVSYTPQAWPHSGGSTPSALSRLCTLTAQL